MYATWYLKMNEIHGHLRFDPKQHPWRTELTIIYNHNLKLDITVVNIMILKIRPDRLIQSEKSRTDREIGLVDPKN